jgi:hypothetical protein
LILLNGVGLNLFSLKSEIYILNSSNCCFC